MAEATGHKSKQSQPKERKRAFFAVFLVGSAVLLAPFVVRAIAIGPGAGAGLVENTADKIGGGMFLSLNWILGAIFVLFHSLYKLAMSNLILPLVRAMLEVRAGDISETVLYGWTIVRNITNMLFILVLVVIGLATILKIEAYNYKKLLGTLILMVLLVNFSLVIGLAVIRVADLATDYFLAPTNNLSSDIIFDRLAKLRSFDADDFFGFRAAFNEDGSLTASMADLTVRVFFAASLELLLFVTFVAMAVFLLIRVAALWVLLILSPFVYFAAILPATKKIASLWWSRFIKYAFFTPILAFFLYLVLSLPPTPFVNFEGDQGAFAQLVQSNVNFIIIIILLWIGLTASAKMSTVGSGAVMGFAKKAALLPVVGAGAAGGAAMGSFGRWYAKKTSEKAYSHGVAGNKWRSRLFTAATLLNPRTVKMGWKKRSEMKEAETYGPAAAHMMDTLNRIMPTEYRRKFGIIPVELGRKTHYGRIAHQQEVNKKYREIAASDFDEVETAKAAIEAFRRGSKEEAEAWLKYVIATNRQDDIANYAKLHKELGLDKYFSGGYVAEKFDQYIKDNLMRFGESTAISIASTAQEFAEMQNKFRSIGMIVTDAQTGEKRFAKDGREKVREQMARMNRGDTERIAQALEAALVRRQDEKGFHELTEVGKIFLKELSPAIIQALMKSRRYQARMLLIGGINPSNTSEIDYDKLKEVLELNPEAAAAIVNKANYEADDLKRLVNEIPEIKEHLSADDKRKLGGSGGSGGGRESKPQEGKKSE